MLYLVCAYKLHAEDLLLHSAVIGQEKKEVELRSEISDFDKSKLSHADTQEKNPLPPAEG